MCLTVISYLSACSVEDCTAEYADAKSLLKHLWRCDMRSKCMDRNSTHFVCLECGDCYKTEQSINYHVQKHQEV